MLFSKQTVRQKMRFFPCYSVGELHRCLLIDHVCELMTSILPSSVTQTPRSNETVRCIPTLLFSVSPHSTLLLLRVCSKP